MDAKALKKLEYDKIVEQLAQKASSFLGKEKARELVPSTDLWEIERSLDETDEAFGMLMAHGEPPFGGVRDIRPVLKRASVSATLSMGELLSVADTLRAVRALQTYGHREPDAPERPVLDPLFDGLVAFADLQKEIERCILSEEEMDDRASDTLSSIRRQIRQAEARVRTELSDMLRSSTYKTMLQEPVIAMRGGRFCLPVKAEFRGSVKGLVHDQSGSGSTVFVEPMSVVMLNNKVADLLLEEKEEIERILRRLSARVTEGAAELEEDLQLVGTVDFLFAKAKLALEMDALRPRFRTDVRMISLPGARHPLIHRSKVVPIHIRLGGDFTTLVITGPNTGGKTVCLKTLGLMVLMGQAGLFLPTSAPATLAVTDQVFADIGDEQSIEQSLSTFSSHMVNIVEILQKVSADSLVLFDELGAGTDPVEGAALANGILESLRERSILTAATTHYSELKTYAISTPGVENASCEFDVETLRPTYRLLIGVPGKSNAFAIAERLGLPNDVIRRSEEYLTTSDIRFEEMMSDLERRRHETEEAEANIRKLREEADLLRKETEEKESQLAARREKMLQEAREEARDILQKAKKEADETIHAMNRMVKEGAQVDMKSLERERTRLREGAKAVEKDMAASRRNAAQISPDDLRKGVKVRIGKASADCIVTVPPDAKGNLTVQAGILPMKINISDVTSIVQEKEDGRKKPENGPKARDRGTSGGSFGKSMTVSFEVDVRGMNTEEALMTVDKYLDDAYLAGLEKVTVIHGKGTGVLRREVQNFLRKRAHVKSFRIGTYGEGENGVTIVELKK